jgi:hypothetical protein
LAVIVKKHRLSGKEDGTHVEYLIVHFPRSRRVKVDDEFNGRTDELIELEAGSHVVTLGPPDNFTPEERRIILRDTSELEPREIDFDLDE